MSWQNLRVDILGMATLKHFHNPSLILFLNQCASINLPIGFIRIMKCLEHGYL